MNQILTIRFISRILHILAAAYIIGQCFCQVAFIDYEVLQSNKKASIWSWIMGIMVAITGFAGLFLILYQKRPQRFYITWEYLLFVKLALCLFLTRITDWIVYRLMLIRQTGPLATPIESTHEFGLYVSITKFIAMLAVVVLSTGAKYYR